MKNLPRAVLAILKGSPNTHLLNPSSRGREAANDPPYRADYAIDEERDGERDRQAYPKHGQKFDYPAKLSKGDNNTREKRDGGENSPSRGKPRLTLCDQIMVYSLMRDFSIYLECWIFPIEGPGTEDEVGPSSNRTQPRTRQRGQRLDVLLG
jgi:hypothetical protein